MEKTLTEIILNKLWDKQDLTADESSSMMSLISEGKFTPVQISALLASLRFKGETVDEIFGLAREMRRRALQIEVDKSNILVDTCGTGGDSKNTFNISTVVAFVIASAGINVAKHGNRSITSRSGSADFLEQLGVNINLKPEEVAQCVNQIGIGFLFAPLLHSSVKNVVGVRKELKLRTVFNVLGPLTNPANADYQIVGVFSEDLTETLAKVLMKLGVKAGMIVCGRDGLDEISLTTTTKISQWSNGKLNTYDFDPQKYGFDYCKMDDLVGGDSKLNVDIAKTILKEGCDLTGVENFKRNIIILNAAAVFLITQTKNSWEEAIEFAKEVISSGKVLLKIKELVDLSNTF